VKKGHTPQREMLRMQKVNRVPAHQHWHDVLAACG
jgi:hypothetical protein